MQDVKVVYEKPVRTSYALTAYEGTSYDASKVETASVVFTQDWWNRSN